MEDILKPEISLLIKLGSIVVHVDEMLSPDGHAFDRIALDALIKDVEVVEWIAEMDKMALTPKKRI